SAADVHVVTLGNEMVGIVHPCKVYGAMAVGRPILFIGPSPSHVADLLRDHAIGEIVAHGDVSGCVAAIRRLRDLPESERGRMGQVGLAAMTSGLSRDILLTRFCDRLAAALQLGNS
ncbi:MAG TPA: hypothetical protein VIY86_00580, partial [Pirellulaceae bacterium]